MTKKKLISPVIVLIVFIYFYCVRGTALEAESSGIQPGTSYRSLSNRRRHPQPSPRIRRAEGGLLFHP